MSREINDVSVALRDLAENRALQSEIGSWSIDLSFCSRILDIYALKAENDEWRLQIASSQKDLREFKDSIVGDLINRLKRSEDRLERLSEDALLLKDREMPYIHAGDLNSVREARNKFTKLRASLYTLIDGLKSI